MIQIDSNYRIETDGTGCTLVKTLNKTRTDKKSNETVHYMTKEEWHFLNVEQCLNRYVDLVIEPSETVVDVLALLRQARLEIKAALK